MMMKTEQNLAIPVSQIEETLSDHISKCNATNNFSQNGTDDFHLKKYNFM